MCVKYEILVLSCYLDKILQGFYRLVFVLTEERRQAFFSAIGKYKMQELKVLTNSAGQYILDYRYENSILYFSYSEWWRYRGPVKPRQPLMQEGANLSE